MSEAPPPDLNTGVSELDFQSPGTTPNRNERINSVHNGERGGGAAATPKQHQGYAIRARALVSVRRPSKTLTRETETKERDTSDPKTTRGAVTEGSLE